MKAQSEKVKRDLRNVTETLPTTIEDINSELQEITADLKARMMRAEDTPEFLTILDRHLKALNQLANNLRTFQIYIDARTQNLTVFNIGPEAVEDFWLRYVDPVFRKLGVDETVKEKAAEDVEDEMDDG